MRYTFQKKKKPTKKKKRFSQKRIHEQGEDEPSLKLMDIIQDILDIEDKVIDVKIKLKKLTPQILKPQNRKLHPSFFKDMERKSSDDDEDDTDDE